MKKQVKQTPPLLKKPIRVSKLKDAKRLLSRLIYEFQLGTLSGRDAKDLTYLISQFIAACKEIEFDDRIKLIEQKIGI